MYVEQKLLIIFLFYCLLFIISLFLYLFIATSNILAFLQLCLMVYIIMINNKGEKCCEDNIYVTDTKVGGLGQQDLRSQVIYQ